MCSLLLAFLAGSPVWADSQIRIRENILVERVPVRLMDIADIMAKVAQKKALSEIVVTRELPFHGDAAAIRGLIADRYGEKFTLDMPPRISMVRGAHVDYGNLLEWGQRLVAQELGIDARALSPHSASALRGKKVLVPEGYVVTLTNMERVNGLISASISISQDAVVYQNYRMAFQDLSLVNALVSVGGIASGADVAGLAFVRREVPAVDLPSDVVRDSSEIRGQISVVPIGSDTVLRRSMFRERYPIELDDSVVVKVANSGVEILISAVSKQAGRVGDRVKLSSSLSMQPFSAYVTGPGRAEVRN